MITIGGAAIGAGTAVLTAKLKSGRVVQPNISAKRDSLTLADTVCTASFRSGAQPLEYIEKDTVERVKDSLSDALDGLSESWITGVEL